MTQIHVCLVSDQTIPNILGVHHFKPDRLLFVTTNDMEGRGKSQSIIETLHRLGLHYEKRHDKITVQEDSILDCHRKIDAWIEGWEDAEFTVNLTCGTKIMSIAAYEYFKDYSSRMIYIPLPKNEFIVPFPKKSPSKPTSLALRLSVVDYLTSYGLNVMNEKKLKGYKDDAIQRREFTDWIVLKYEKIKNLLVWMSGVLRSHRDDKQYFVNAPFLGASREENEFIARVGASYDNSNGVVSKTFNRSEIRYLTGGWLEEYCFNEITAVLGQSVDNVVLGVQLMNAKGRDNEFDVMFTKENALYFIECKSLDQHDDRKTEVLYKIGALQKEFGLRVRSILVTTSPYILKDGQMKESVRARAEQFNTEVIPPSKVAAFGAIVSKMLSEPSERS